MRLKSNNKVNLAVIGCGNIAQFHIPAMREVGFNIVAIAGSLNSKNVLTFAQKYKIDKVYNNPLDMVKNVSQWDALLMLSPVSTMIDYLNIAIQFGKPILCEKPVALNHEYLKDFIQYKNIRVAYNRRFYSGVKFSRKYVQKHPNSLIKVTIPENRKDPVHNINFPDRLPLMSYENSVHMFDLINYISKGVKWKQTSSIKELDKFIMVNALGYGGNGAIIQLDSCFNSPDNFSINILSGDERVEMKPIEVTSLFKGMKVNEPTVEMPIRTYTPKLQKKIIDFPTSGHKPGFLGQAQDFMNFCLGRKDCAGADIMDAYSALKLAQSLAK